MKIVDSPAFLVLSLPLSQIHFFVEILFIEKRKRREKERRGKKRREEEY
jgi:hypothetical protein